MSFQRLLISILVLSVSTREVLAESKYNKLGNLSPYHKGPVPHGVSETLPNDCVVDQVMLVRNSNQMFLNFIDVHCVSLPLDGATWESVALNVGAAVHHEPDNETRPGCKVHQQCTTS